MSSSPRTVPAAGAFSRRFTAYAGLFFDEFDRNSAWIRERATVRLPPLTGVSTLVIRGIIQPHPETRGTEVSIPQLRVAVNGRVAARLRETAAGPWELRIALTMTESTTLTLDLLGVGLTNLLAWLGRM